MTQIFWYNVPYTMVLLKAALLAEMRYQTEARLRSLSLSQDKMAALAGQYPWCWETRAVRGSRRRHPEKDLVTSGKQLV